MNEEHDTALELSDLLPLLEAARFLRAELGYNIIVATRIVKERRGIEIGERKA